jgi:hypothetical protein
MRLLLPTAASVSPPHVAPRLRLSYPFLYSMSIRSIYGYDY